MTIPLTSLVLLGRRTVLDSLARLEKADTYCSATVSEAAAFPFWAGYEKKKERRSERTEESLSRVRLIKNDGDCSPAETEPPTEPGSPSISPQLWPRRPGLHLEGNAAINRRYLTSISWNLSAQKHTKSRRNPPAALLICSAFSPSDARI